MKKRLYDYMQNRELSWLRFNERVLEEATDPSVPLLERLKFLSIFTSNLDEFFMIRVGSLYDLSIVDDNAADNKTGWTPSEQLDAIYEQVGPLYRRRDDIYAEVVRELSEYDVYAKRMSELDEIDQKIVKKHFKKFISPLLSPQIVDHNHPFPHLPSKEIHIMALLKDHKKRMLGIIPVPDVLPDVLFIPGDKISYIHMEDILLDYAEEIFGMYQVVEKDVICVTRNADITNDDELYDESVDFRLAMKKLLSKRKRLAVVRLETSGALSTDFSEILQDRFQIMSKQIFVSQAPMKLKYAFSIDEQLPVSLSRALKEKEFEPTLPSNVHPHERVLRQVKNEKFLFHHPFESMDMFLEMIKEASVAPEVISIKMTIYRLAQKAKLVEYLSEAAENGKEVTVIIELRARFDEQNNIDWSERLEEAGCRVIYGFDEYKVHSKICLITYRYKGTIRYITQVGTGNYNESTVKLYTDLSLVTHDKWIGEDAAEFFKNMAIGNLNGNYSYLLVSPNSFKSSILRLIEREAQKGSDGRIAMKMNSITDKDIIKALSKASQQGTKIDMIVRGICCILPGVEGKTENITVRSIVGRFLEHSRIYRFGEGSDSYVYIASADLMTRNTERRVEVACPIMDPELKQKVDDILQVCFQDNVKARMMRSDGIYEIINGHQEPFHSQEYFLEKALEHGIDLKLNEIRRKTSLKDRIKRRLIAYLSR